MKKPNLRSKPRWLLEILGLVALLATYGMASLAIDSGSWWHYLAALILFVSGIRWLYFVIVYENGDKHKKAART